MNKENKLIPELRFPEFVHNGEWVVKEVGELFQVTRGYVLAMSLVNETQNVEYPYPVFSSQTKNNGLAGYYNEFLYEDAITWTTDGANAGDVNYRHGKFYCTNVCGVLINQDGFANPCIAELINSVSKQHVSYVGNPKLMNGVMSKIKIPIPSLLEQQKIADCFSSIDQLIQASNHKLEALKYHKKGLMQNLFPREGEKEPKFRFPEFENDGKWVEKKLGKIGEPLMCKRIFKDQTTLNSENGIPFYKIGTFGEVADSFIPVDLYNQFKSRYNFPNKGDILISASGTIGKLVVYDGHPAYFQDSNIVWLGHDKKQVTNEFLYYCYSMVNWQTSDGGVIKRLYNSDLKNISINFPENESEQKKVADCLAALDDLITKLTEKTEQLKLHKIGLMQGLFPQIK